ncbi:MAG: hypothetical protein M3R00_03295 [Pseudomonadota bacterium]|nr:hypothetical protein [Pseudomonadota bacterium]
MRNIKSGDRKSSGDDVDLLQGLMLICADYRDSKKPAQKAAVLAMIDVLRQLPLNISREYVKVLVVSFKSYLHAKKNTKLLNRIDEICTRARFSENAQAEIKEAHQEMFASTKATLNKTNPNLYDDVPQIREALESLSASRRSNL